QSADVVESLGAPRIQLESGTPLLERFVQMIAFRRDDAQTVVRAREGRIKFERATKRLFRSLGFPLHEPDGPDVERDDAARRGAPTRAVAGGNSFGPAAFSRKRHAIRNQHVEVGRLTPDKG